MLEALNSIMLGSDAVGGDIVNSSINTATGIIIVYAVLLFSGFLLGLWMWQTVADIKKICAEFVQVRLVFKSRESELNSGQVREILGATSELKITSSFWAYFLSVLLAKNPQSPNSKIQTTVKLQEIFSAKKILLDCLGPRKLFMIPAAIAGLFFVSILLLNIAMSVGMFVNPNMREVLNEFVTTSSGLIMSSALLLFSVVAAFSWRVLEVVGGESDSLKQLLQQHIEYQDNMMRLVQVQRDISRLTVQVSLVESSMASMGQAKNLHKESGNFQSPTTRQLTTIPASNVNIRKKQVALDEAAASVRDVVAMIDMACDTISVDVEATYRKLMNKYGNGESSRNNIEASAVIPGVIETRAKISDSARVLIGQWDSCKKTKPAFEEVAAFLDNAENCVITLTNLKNNIIELGMNHSNEQSRNSPMGDLSKVTQNYILMGDIMTEIRNTIGKLSANSHDVGEAWKNFQSQIDSLNRNQKDKLYAARGIVSTCFRTVSTQMAQIQIDLNNHLRNISNTIGGQ
jgi:hypothetical protein